MVFSFIMMAAGVFTFAGGGTATDVVSTYGGRAIGVATHVPLIGDATYGDTGDLPAQGGALFADFTPVDVPLASATVFSPYTRGFAEAAKSEAATSDITLIPGSGFDVVSSFVYAGTTATCSGVNAASQVFELSVAGVPVDVTGAPNQVYSILGVLTLVINEQIDGSHDGIFDVTANALDLTLADGTQAVVSSAHSEVTCGPSDSGGLGLPLAVGLSTLSVMNTGPNPMWVPQPDFMTGGGFFFVPPTNPQPHGTCYGIPFDGDRVNFGFNAGARPGDPNNLKGHLNVIDHDQSDCPIRHIQGTDVDEYFPFGDESVCRAWEGPATVDGQSGNRYSALTCDYGEPGRMDRFEITVYDGTGFVIYHADNAVEDCPAADTGQTCHGDLPGGNIQLHEFG